MNQLQVMLASGKTKVIENRGLWGGAMLAMLHCPLALEVIPERERKRFESVMTKGLSGAQQQAA